MPCISKQPYKYIIYTHVYHTYWHILPIYILCKITNIYICTHIIYIYTFPHTLSPCWSQARSERTTRPCCSIAASIWPWLPAGIPGDSCVHWAYWWRSTHYWAGGVAFRDALHFGYCAMYRCSKKQKSQVAFRGNKLVELSWLAYCTFLPILRSEQCWKMVSWSCWYNWTSWKLTGQIC